MTQPFYTAQTDVAVGTRGKATDINNLDSAVEQGFKNAHAYGIDSGTSAAYVVTMDTDATAYYDGMVVSFAPDNTNSVQSPTINVNGLGAKSTSSANQLSGVVEIGEIKTGYVYTFVYYLTGFVLQGSARLNTIPGPIGSGTPSTGAFTTLSASSTVSGAGFTARFAAPGPIGSVTPSTGAFTTLTATTFSTTKSTADVEGPIATNTSTNAAAVAAYSAYNSAGDYLIAGVLSTNYALSDAFGPGYGAVYCLKKLVLSSSDNGVFINVNGGTLVGTFTSTGLKIAGSINSRGGDNASATNSAFGEGALDSNSGGTGNTAVGNDALTAMVGNSGATAVGCQAANANTAAGTTAIGFEALKTNITGTSNTAAGYQALRLNTGNANTAVGNLALTTNSTGEENTAVGHLALSANATGAANTAVGFRAVEAATGSANTAVGSYAGISVTTGTNNVFIGESADADDFTANSSVAIGSAAKTTKSNQVVLGGPLVTEVTTAGNLQILSGTAVPAGGTAGAGLRFSTTANLGVFFGSGAPSLAAAKGSLYLRTDGSTTNNRMYVNTDGGTTWTAVTTAA